MDPPDRTDALSSALANLLTDRPPATAFLPNKLLGPVARRGVSAKQTRFRVRHLAPAGPRPPLPGAASARWACADQCIQGVYVMLTRSPSGPCSRSTV